MYLPFFTLFMTCMEHSRSTCLLGGDARRLNYFPHAWLNLGRLLVRRELFFSIMGGARICMQGDIFWHFNWIFDSMIDTTITSAGALCQWTWVMCLGLYSVFTSGFSESATGLLFLSKQPCLLNNSTSPARTNFWEGVVAHSDTGQRRPLLISCDGFATSCIWLCPMNEFLESAWRFCLELG